MKSLQLLKKKSEKKKKEEEGKKKYFSLKKHSKNNSLGELSGDSKAGGRPPSSLIQRRNQELENSRLIKRLAEISRRKSEFAEEGSQNGQYYTINLKNRIKDRERREIELQLQNDLLVDRIARKRSPSRLRLLPFFQGAGRPKHPGRKRKSNQTALQKKFQLSLPKI